MLDTNNSDPEKAYILKLPPEILTIIFEFAVFEGEYPRHHLDTTKSLALTCHRFSNIAAPLFYKTIKIEVPTGYEKVAKIHKALQRNPSLGHYCKYLRVEIIPSYGTPLMYAAANDIIESSRGVKHLHIRKTGRAPNPNRYTWKLICNVAQHMSQIEELNLGSHDDELYLKDVVKYVDIPSLRHLFLHRLYSDSKAFVLDKMKYRTAPFTSLTISDYNESPESMRQLISWPKALSCFCWLGCCKQDDFRTRLLIIQSSLLLHKETLKTIDLTVRNRKIERCIFNASEFPNLEVLKLSKWYFCIRWQFPNYFHEFSAADADSLLRAPKLKVLALDYGPCEYCEPSSHICWEGFGDEEENLVRHIVKAAVDMKAALRKIKIYNSSRWNVLKMDVYPWDRMDRINDDIQPFGLTLEYDDPKTSKQEWLDYRERKRIYEETTLDDELVVAQSPDRLW